MVGVVIWALLATVSYAQLGFSDYYNYQGFSPSFIEFNEIGGGARSAGMGGAFLAIGEGEMAFSWNPAAMIYTDKSKVGLQTVSVSDKFKSVSWITSDTGFVSAEPFDYKRDHFSLDYGGFVAPFAFMDREWAVGGGYRNVYDMNLEFNIQRLIANPDTYTSSRGVDAVSIGVANRIFEGVGAGLTVNAYVRGTETSYFIRDAYLYQGPGYSTPVIADAWINDKSQFSGFNVDLGLAGDFGVVKGAAVFHTPYDLKQDSKRSYNIVVEPAPVGILDRVTYTYSMPFSYSLGIAVVPVENLTLAFDFDSQPLSDVEIKTNWEQILIPDSDSFNPGWEDLNQFRVGVEYFMDAGFADIPVRAGFRNEPSVAKQLDSLYFDVSDSSYVRREGKQISTSIFSLGTGLYFDRIWFDLAYQFGSSSYDRYLDMATPMTFEIKRDYSRLFLSAGMYF